ncbi:hypothetical protein ACVR1G_07395, partial [Streptococcus dentasini]
YDAASSGFFSDIAGLEADVSSGLTLLNQGIAGFNGSFTMPSKKDLEWTKTINSQWDERDRRLTEAYQSVVRKVSNGEELTDSDIKALITYAQNHPNTQLSTPMMNAINTYYTNHGVNVPTKESNKDSGPSIANTILQYMSNIGDLVKGAGGWVVSSGTDRLAKIISKITVASQGGAGGFVILDTGKRLYRNGYQKGLATVSKGNAISKFGRVLSNPYVQLAAFGVGVWNDVANKGKTVGQGITHTGASTAVGLGTSALTTAVITGIAGGPVGWAALAGAAVGYGAVQLFELGYDHNFLGMQDGLDAAGEWIDKGAGKAKDWVEDNAGKAKDWVEDKADKVGDAISSGISAINPFD